MQTKSLSFDTNNTKDISLFAQIIAELQYNSVKFTTERDESSSLVIIRFA